MLCGMFRKIMIFGIQEEELREIAQQFAWLAGRRGEQMFHNRWWSRRWLHRKSYAAPLRVHDWPNKLAQWSRPPFHRQWH